MGVTCEMENLDSSGERVSTEDAGKLETANVKRAEKSNEKQKVSKVKSPLRRESVRKEIEDKEKSPDLTAAETRDEMDEQKVGTNCFTF